MSSPSMKWLFTILVEKAGSNNAREPLCEAEERGNKNRKGRDIGCALAANSCEGATSVEARTVTAP